MRNQGIGLIDLFNDLLRKGKYIVMATLAGMIPTGVFLLFFGEKKHKAAVSFKAGCESILVKSGLTGKGGAHGGFASHGLMRRGVIAE